MNETKTDKQRLIHAVAKRNCLYDLEDPDYKNRETTEAAWNLVALEIKDTVANAKQRWENICNIYERLLTTIGSKRNRHTRDGYLLKEMEFCHHLFIGSTQSNETTKEVASKLKPHEQQKQSEQQQESLILKIKNYGKDKKPATEAITKLNSSTSNGPTISEPSTKAPPAASINNEGEGEELSTTTGQLCGKSTLTNANNNKETLQSEMLLLAENAERRAASLNNFEGANYHPNDIDSNGSPEELLVPMEESVHVQESPKPPPLRRSARRLTRLKSTYVEWEGRGQEDEESNYTPTPKRPKRRQSTKPSDSSKKNKDKPSKSFSNKTQSTSSSVAVEDALTVELSNESTTVATIPTVLSEPALPRAYDRGVQTDADYYLEIGTLEREDANLLLFMKNQIEELNKRQKFCLRARVYQALCEIKDNPHEFPNSHTTGQQQQQDQRDFLRTKLHEEKQRMVSHVTSCMDSFISDVCEGRQNSTINIDSSAVGSSNSSTPRRHNVTSNNHINNNHMTNASHGSPAGAVQASTPVGPLPKVIKIAQAVNGSTLRRSSAIGGNHSNNSNITHILNGSSTAVPVSTSSGPLPKVIKITTQSTSGNSLVNGPNRAATFQGMRNVLVSTSSSSSGKHGSVVVHSIPSVNSNSGGGTTASAARAVLESRRNSLLRNSANHILTSPSDPGRRFSTNAASPRSTDSQPTSSSVMSTAQLQSHNFEHPRRIHDNDSRNIKNSNNNGPMQDRVQAINFHSPKQIGQSSAIAMSSIRRPVTTTTMGQQQQIVSLLSSETSNANGGLGSNQGGSRTTNNSRPSSAVPTGGSAAGSSGVSKFVNTMSDAFSKASYAKAATSNANLKTTTMTSVSTSSANAIAQTSSKSSVGRQEEETNSKDKSSTRLREGDGSAQAADANAHSSKSLATEEHEAENNEPFITIKAEPQENEIDLDEFL